MVPECYEDNSLPVTENPFLRTSSYQWHLLSEQWSIMTSLLGGHFSQIKTESWAKLKTLFLVPALPISRWLVSVWWSLPLSGPPSPLNADTLGCYRADLPYSLPLLSALSVLYTWARSPELLSDMPTAFQAELTWVDGSCLWYWGRVKRFMLVHGLNLHAKLLPKTV